VNFYITGDTHRNFTDIEGFCGYNETTADDVMIILGDVGINYHGVAYDTYLKQQLAQLPITLFCVHGNHENRPENISSYDEVPMFGGVVYIEPEFPNLIFARCGEIYRLGDFDVLVVGGAHSINKHELLAQKSGWWPDEQPSDWIKEETERNLASRNWQVDIVLTHTCPYKYMPREAFLSGVKEWMTDHTTEKWLETIEERLDYQVWYCGHFHIEKDVGKMQFLYRSILELGEY